MIQAFRRPGAELTLEVKAAARRGGQNFAAHVLVVDGCYNRLVGARARFARKGLVPEELTIRGCGCVWPVCTPFWRGFAITRFCSRLERCRGLLIGGCVGRARCRVIRPGLRCKERRSSLACIGAKVILFPRGLVAAASVLRG